MRVTGRGHALSLLIKKAISAATVVITGVCCVAPASAATLTYDADTTAPANDGGGVWDTSTANWFDGTNDVVWPNTTADTAVFGAGSGAAGGVTVGTVTANGLTFNAAGSGNYTLNTGTITLGGTTPTINVASGVTPTINALLAGSGGFTKSGAGTLILGNVFNSGLTGGISITEGTIAVGSSASSQNALNGQTVTLGASTGTAGAAFQVNRNQNYNSPIIVQANATAGTLRIAGGPALGVNQSPTILSAITLNNNVTIGNGAGGNVGGVALGGAITGDATRTITIDGSNATTLAIISTNNAATLSSNITVTSGQLRLNAASAAGTGTVTVSGGANASLHGNNATSAPGNVVVTNGSHVAPGANAMGALPTGNSNFGTAGGTVGLATAVTSALTLTNANLDFDLAATAAGTSDRINTNSLVMTNVTFNFNALTPGSIELGTAYTLITTPDAGPAIALPGTIGTTFTTASNVNYAATYSVNGTNDLVVTFSLPVPEPASLGLLMLGALPAVRRRR